MHGSTGQTTEERLEEPISPGRVTLLMGWGVKGGELTWIGSRHSIPLMDQMTTIVHLSGHVPFCCDLNFALNSFGLQSSEGGLFQNRS